jgi:hypothetical protein
MFDNRGSTVLVNEISYWTVYTKHHTWFENRAICNAGLAIHYVIFNNVLFTYNFSLIPYFDEIRGGL